MKTISITAITALLSAASVTTVVNASTLPQQKCIADPAKARHNKTVRFKYYRKQLEFYFVASFFLCFAVCWRDTYLSKHAKTCCSC